jgi:hypothetical protein
MKRGVGEMSKFTEAIAANWLDYVISPGAAKLSCCIDWNPKCQECDGHGYDYENEPHDDCGYCDGTGEAPLDDISDEELQLWDEGSFSWQECDSCGSRLGGDRFKAHAIHKEAFGPDAKRPDDIHHIDICVDCVMFHANGDEPESWE